MGAQRRRRAPRGERSSASSSRPGWGWTGLGLAGAGLLVVVGVAMGRCGPDASAPLAPPRPATPPRDEPPRQAASQAGAADEAPAPVERLSVVVHRTLPHDPDAFTQGLLLFEGSLYESTGLRRHSRLRRVTPDDGVVRAEVSLEPELFGEGLARVDRRLVQLTWQSGRALVWDLDGFERLDEHRYQGEGWGLCFDGERLVMSDGSDRLTFRSPEDFRRLGSVDVTLEGRPVFRLNELECVDGLVWANVWTRDEILRIDPRTGAVTGVVDASSLRRSPARSRTDEVLNGIAAIPGTDRFFVTGKHWSQLHEVEFVPAGD